ncbi:MAG TPA: biotin/lipoyl-binding protein, partial [Chitinophagaceae bacterium]|nr:biotin/lipoyl-binding protein [Chitinophagaceae bacterium]
MKSNVGRLVLMAGCGLWMSAALYSCSSSDGEQENKQAAEVPPAPTEIVSVQKGRLAASLQLPGELQAFQQVDIYAKVSSFVKKLYVDVGSEVSAGQLLVTMEAPELSAQLAGADSKLKSLEALYIAS